MTKTHSSGNMLLGEAPALHAVLRAARLVACADVTVLIQGESGTGKELLAQEIHAGSRRSARPLIAVNCAALPEALAESELFGHRRGAFTGADRDREGHIPAADGGTLFLDEIAELPLSAQAKLLRFLENGECQAVGAAVPRKVNVRVIAATHRDLAAAVRAGHFRDDLYYRLQVVPLLLPPLRERREDIPLLVRHLSREAARRFDVAPPHFTPAALQALQRHAWPGNVRELRNLCERLTVLMSGQTIEPTNLPPEVRGHVNVVAATGTTLPEMEVAMIRDALIRTNGNRTRAARLLGLTRDTLNYRLKKFAIVDL